MTDANPWTWSEQYQDYYRSAWGANGQPVYIWAKQAQAPRHDSPTHGTYQAPTRIRQETEYIYGTDGRRENLDASYIVREGAECNRFFRKGRVLSMLWSEAAGSTASNNRVSDAFSVVRFGETVYSNIRRFVVVHVPNNKGFVYACGITTYSNRGVLKDGCSPEDHSAVYLTGTAPAVMPAEVEKGMTNEAIEVEPFDNTESMSWASRINFGKTVAIEKNVKVKEVGRVIHGHMSNLTAFWRKAKGDEDDD